MEPDRCYVRDPEVVLASTAATLMVLAPSGAVADVPCRDPDRWSRMAQGWSTPIAASTLARAAGDERAVLQRLVECGLLVPVRRAGAPARPRRQAVCDHLVLAVTGCAFAALAPALAVGLRALPVAPRIDVVLTRSARRFAPRAAFAVHGMRTWVDEAAVDSTGAPGLARSADCVLVLPASARTLSRLAIGNRTDLLSRLVAATAAPVVLAPAMDAAAWSCEAVRADVGRLRRAGMVVVEPTPWRDAAGVARLLRAVLAQPAAPANALPVTKSLN